VNKKELLSRYLLDKAVNEQLMDDPNQNITAPDAYVQNLEGPRSQYFTPGGGDLTKIPKDQQANYGGGDVSGQRQVVMDKGKKNILGQTVYKDVRPEFVTNISHRAMTDRNPELAAANVAAGLPSYSTDLMDDSGFFQGQQVNVPLGGVGDLPGSNLSMTDVTGQELDSKYVDRKRKYKFDPDTGETTEYVKRKGPLGWLGGHKKTGRSYVDQKYRADSGMPTPNIDPNNPPNPILNVDHDKGSSPVADYQFKESKRIKEMYSRYVLDKVWGNNNE